MYKIAPEVKVGDTFTRIDKNGTVWIAKVINRTSCFVDVLKYHPYEVKFATGYYAWEYETRIPEPTKERARINVETKSVETGEMCRGIFGEYPKTKIVPTGNYFITIKEDYSKYPEYDKVYFYNRNGG